MEAWLNVDQIEPKGQKRPTAKPNSRPPRLGMSQRQQCRSRRRSGWRPHRPWRGGAFHGLATAKVGFVAVLAGTLVFCWASVFKEQPPHVLFFLFGGADPRLLTYQHHRPEFIERCFAEGGRVLPPSPFLKYEGKCGYQSLIAATNKQNLVRPALINETVG